MTKKILFVLYKMNVGGVEKAFLNLLSTLDPKEYEIDLLLLQKTGGFLDCIPDYVNIEELDVYNKVCDEVSKPLHLLAIDRIKHGRLRSGLLIAYEAILHKITDSNYHIIDSVLRREPIRDKQYDIAISYASPFMFIDYYVVNKVKAAKKLCWIHFDISQSKIDKKATRTIYKEFDKINVVSDQGKKIFDSYFPEFSNKTFVRYNDVNPNEILQLADEINPRQKCRRKYVICTVGRVSWEKGQGIAISVLNSLVVKGFDIEWWFVGEGNALEHCKRKAIDLGIEDRSIFWGTQKNPYPFMKQCDIYVQPSVHEGFCITLAEAKLFGKPIVATDFTGAKEQLTDYCCYNIVSYSEDSLLKGVETIISSLK